MKRNLLERIFIPGVLLLLACFFYYLFYKPVEGFFAKTDACDRARRDQTFIQNQVNDVSNNLVNLQGKLNKVGEIRSELQGLLTKFACLQFNTTNPACTTAINEFNSIQTQITNAQVDKKTFEDRIAEANTRIPQLTANITAKTTQNTQLQTDPFLNCDPAKGSVSLSAEQCRAITDLTRNNTTEITRDTALRTNFNTQLTTATKNLEDTNKRIASLEASRRGVQTRLDSSNCTSVKNTFSCSELNGQLKLLERSIENAKKEQSFYQTFFTEKSAPLMAINDDLNNYSC